MTYPWLVFGQGETYANDGTPVVSETADFCDKKSVTYNFSNSAEYMVGVSYYGYFRAAKDGSAKGQTEGLAAFARQSGDPQVLQQTNGDTDTYTVIYELQIEATSIGESVGNVISINFASNQGSSSAVDYTGIVKLPASAWNNVTGEKQESAKTDGITWMGIQSETLSSNWSFTWSAAHTWYSGSPCKILYGYLDDNDAVADQATVNMMDIPFKAYDLYVYKTGDNDNAALSYISLTVGRFTKNYTCGEDGIAYEGTTTWGSAKDQDAALGTNVIKIAGLTASDFTLKGGFRNTGRGGIAAIQIVDTSSNMPTVKPAADGTLTLTEAVTTPKTIDFTGAVTIVGGLISGDDYYTETDDDLAKLVPGDGVTTITLGAHTEHNLGTLRDASADGYKYLAGATVVVSATTDEYRAGALTVTGLVEGMKVKVNLPNGTSETLTADAAGSATFTGDVHVADKGCWMDYTFTLASRQSRIDSEGEGSRYIYSTGEDTANYIFTDSDYYLTNSLSETTGYLYMKSTPYATVTYPTEFTAATYATMPARENDTLMAFGTNLGGCIALVRGASENEIKVVWAKNGATTVGLATLKVKNALKNKHLVAFTMTSDYIYVYLDGKQKSKVEMKSTYTMGSGFQIGSVHGGELSGSCNRAQSTDPAEIAMIRLYKAQLSAAERAALVKEFPAENDGSSTRTFDAAAEDWVATGAWKVPGESEQVAADAPKASSDVVITADYETEETITLNLTDAESIGDLSVIGTGSIKIVKGEDSAALEVTGDVTIDAPLTVAYGDLDLSAVSIENNSSITMDISALSETITNLYKTTTVTVLGPTTGDGEVTFTNKPTLEGPGTLGDVVQNETTGAYEITYTTDHEQGDDIYYVSGYLGADSGTDKLVVKNAKGDECSTFPGDIVTFDSTYTSVATVWVPTTLPANIGGLKVNTDISLTSGDGTILAGKTVTIASTATLTIAWNKDHTTTLGKVVFNGGTVKLAGAVEVGGAITGTSTIQIDEDNTVKVVTGGSIANTLSGAGTLSLADGMMPNLTTGSDWTGTIEVGTVSGHLTQNGSYGTIKIGEGKTLTLNDGYGKSTNTIAKITGAGNLAITKTGLAGTNTIIINDVTGFTGTITTTASYPIVLPEGYVITTDNYVKAKTDCAAKVDSNYYIELDDALTAAGTTKTVTILKALNTTVNVTDALTVTCEANDVFNNIQFNIGDGATLTMNVGGNNNQVWKVQGAKNATTKSKFIVNNTYNFGLNKGTVIRDVAMTINSSSAYFYIEDRTSDPYDATVDIDVEGNVVIGNYDGTTDHPPVFGNLKGKGTITEQSFNSRNEVLTLTLTDDYTFEGDIAPNLAIAGTGSLTVKGTVSGTVTAADTATYGVLTKTVEGGTKYYLGYKVTFEKGDHVAAFKAGETTFGADYTFEKDTDFTFTVSVDAGYEIEAVKIGDVAIDPVVGTTDTFTVTCDGAKTIKATAKATATVTPIDPTKSTDPYESADDAQKAIDDGKVTVGASAEVATALDNDEAKLAAYKGLFTLVVTSDNRVAQVLSETGTNTVQGTVTGAVSPVLTAALDSEQTTATVTTTPGIYYAIVYGTAVNGLDYNTKGEMATTTSTELAMPRVTGDKAFFRVKASVTPIEAKTED